MTLISDDHSWPQICVGDYTLTVWLSPSWGIGADAGEWEAYDHPDDRRWFLNEFKEEAVPLEEGLSYIPEIALDFPDPYGVVPQWFRKMLRDYHDKASR